PPFEETCDTDPQGRQWGELERTGRSPISIRSKNWGTLRLSLGYPIWPHPRAVTHGWMAFRFHLDCGLCFGLVGRHDHACRTYVIPNQLHVHGVRGAAEELFAFSKNYRTGEQ